MSQTFNVYCDESCHLENDGQQIMVLGAVKCPLSKTEEFSKGIREIKKRHKLTTSFEIKWTKVSATKLDFYTDIVDYFFDNEDLQFRGLVVRDKSQLNHRAFSHDHDTWYYIMYFRMLMPVIVPPHNHLIYLDIKDSRSEKKVQGLKKYLRNAKYDFDKSIIARVQQIRSHESEMLQICDLFIGAIGYLNRGLSENKAKVKVIEQIQRRSGKTLKISTWLSEEKFNLFFWDAAEVNNDREC